jgi:SAM-dependent methyltransferase
MNKFEKANKVRWNMIMDEHIRFYYKLNKFKGGKSSLDKIQLKEIGQLKGKSLLHLQCNCGIDTLSLARRGAIVTGVDFSDKAIEYAKNSANDLNIKAEFICCNIYDLKKHLDRKFDIVYTSEGVLCWLKDLSKWAKLISYYLKSGGMFYILEEHPIIRTFDDTSVDKLKIAYKYFNKKRPTNWAESTLDSVDKTNINGTPSYEWQWSMSDIINSLVKANLGIKFIHEFDKMFYKALPGMKQDKEGWWYIPGYRKKIPLMFTLKAVRL